MLRASVEISVPGFGPDFKWLCIHTRGGSFVQPTRGTARPYPSLAINGAMFDRQFSWNDCAIARGCDCRMPVESVRPAFVALVFQLGLLKRRQRALHLNFDKCRVYCLISVFTDKHLNSPQEITGTFSRIELNHMKYAPM